MSVFACGGTGTTTDEVDPCRPEAGWLESSLTGSGGGKGGTECNCERSKATEVEGAAGEGVNCFSELPDDVSPSSIDGVVTSCHA